ncbi:sigma-70 family RNA polymerase sigma factor [Bacillus carboniphilus]|uniref:Sigma-70 family RNA polymerase sigma factor n=1 Tax=Bacillus carboniphilus TaxID=86663 RepID=A0ABY9JQU3_9BACI|nr:sigma-70 family RNA polymerase sigma factor [Bacillus carboniphilus]WLR41770.1 sigma-70 family RNA polymerase sigma factor [Bacillus carboniphilus]
MIQTDVNNVNYEDILYELVLDYSDELKRIAYLYVNIHVEADDIVQEVFISCYKNLSKFRSDASYKTWLIRITINKCKDYRRKWHVKNIINKSEIEINDVEKSSDDLIIEQENNNEMIKQLSLLPPKYKDVLILHYYQEMTMEEISTVLKLNINTVKSRIYRGKDRLKDQLERRNIIL